MVKEEKEKNSTGGNGEDKGGNGEDKTGFEGAVDSEAVKKEQEELISKLQEEIDKLTTKDIVVQVMMSLSSLGYKKMGIPAGVNDKFKDRAQAKLAIDSFEALLKVLENEASAREVDDLRSSLANLQLNFVKSFV